MVRVFQPLVAMIDLERHARPLGATAVQSAVRAHEALSRLAKVRAAADAEEGRWLLAALRSGAHVHLGFGSFAEYAERLFGYRPRSTQENCDKPSAQSDYSTRRHVLRFELVPIGGEVVAMAHCDGQRLGLLDPPVAVESATADESATAVESAHTGASSKPEASSRRPRAHTGARAFSSRGAGRRRDVR